jgi:AcrR family transcriptional regulator
MKTRDKILQEARRQFNEKGLENVSLRDIAGGLQISQGNLTYHFPKRDDIVLALYQELVSRLNQDFEEAGQHTPNPAQLLYATASIYKAFDAYRFLMIDLAQVMRKYPQIWHFHQQLQELRKAQSMALFSALVEAGWMKPAQYPEQFSLLLMHMTVVGDFYIAGATTIYDLPDHERGPTYLALVREMFSHYLTDKGREQMFAVSLVDCFSSTTREDDE